MPRERSSNLVDAVISSFTVLAVLFGVKAAEILFRLPLAQFGIIPRTAAGLWGILFGPLLHVNLTHLMANALPLFVLLVLLQSNPRYHPYQTLALIWTASGLGTWLIGRGHSVHIGASSIIFGLAAFLIVAGFLMKSWRSAAVAVFVLIAFGGIFYGVLPQAGPISWEGHLCGGVAGAWTAARTMRSR
jgi:membrane associated rhomboid family serine protease